MDSNNNESTSTSVETDKNAWQLVIPKRDSIDTLISLFKEYKDINLNEARETFEYLFEDAQREYNEVVDQANDKLEEIRELIEESDWGKSLVNYEDQHDGCNPTLHKLLHGLTGIDDFLYDHDRHDGHGFEFYDNGSQDNPDGISSLIEDLEELEKFDEVDETLDQDTSDWGDNMNIFDVHVQLSSLPIERAKQLITHVISKTTYDTHKDFRYQLKELANHFGVPTELTDNNCLFNEVKVVNVGD
tara:strand:- start:762 stop:1496 length:735 start_codon:yes stop_codon:yes gene_type:complete